MNQFVTPVSSSPVNVAPPVVTPAVVRKDVANIHFILDKSGSMRSICQQAIDGFNKYTASQRAHPGITRMTFVQFDDKREVIYENRNVREVPELCQTTYVPDGYTALNDAVGFVLSKNLPLASRDETNAVVILTDGAENASKEYTTAQAKALIAQAQAEGWEVLFLGANMRAEDVVNTYGIDASNVSAFAATAKGTSDAFSTLSASTSAYRGMKSMGNLEGRVNVGAAYAAAAASSEVLSAADLLNQIKGTATKDKPKG